MLFIYTFFISVFGSALTDTLLNPAKNTLVTVRLISSLMAGRNYTYYAPESTLT